MTDPRPPLIPALTTLSGSYTHTSKRGIDWEYVYDIHAAGTHGETRVGRLSVRGVDLSCAVPGDLIRTPWGTMTRAADTPAERGWLLERTDERSPNPSRGAYIELPDDALARDGRWVGAVGAWTYSVRADAMGSRSERRVGHLSYHRVAITGEKPGDHVDTPWGRARWTGPVNEENATDYEQGFLLAGTFDRPLDEMVGDPLTPGETAHRVVLESLYTPGIKLGDEGPTARRVTLSLSGRPDHATELRGSLVLDPNACSINDFGDVEACTRMASREVKVMLTLDGSADPKGLGRHRLVVQGDGLPAGVALVVYRRMERCYLHVNDQLVPLYVEDGV